MLTKIILYSVFFFFFKDPSYYKIHFTSVFYEENVRTAWKATILASDQALSRLEQLAQYSLSSPSSEVIKFDSSQSRVAHSSAIHHP